MTEINLETIEYLNKKAESIQKYSEKLTEGLTEFDEILTPILEKVGINVEATKPVVIEGGECGNSYFLYLGNNRHGNYGIFCKIYTDCMEGAAKKWLPECPYKVQREAVKQLPEFLELYVKAADARDRACKKALELLESYLKAIRAVDDAETLRIAGEAYRKDHEEPSMDTGEGGG